MFTISWHEISAEQAETSSSSLPVATVDLGFVMPFCRMVHDVVADDLLANLAVMAGALACEHVGLAMG